MKNCISCGKALPDEASFCMYCMTQLSPVTEVASRPARVREKNIAMYLLTTVCLATAAGVVFLFGRINTLQALSAGLRRAGNDR